MDIRQLKYFVAIIESGSILSASKHIGVAQPALSQHIQRLEKELGVELLVRSARGVSPTASGEILLERALSILNELELAVNEIKAHSCEVRGSVRIGMPSSITNVLSVPLTETVREQHPKLLLRTLDAMSGFVREWLTQGKVDLCILYNTDRLKHLKTRALLTEELFLIAAADDWDGPIAADGIAETGISLLECSALPLILPHRTHGLRDCIEHFAESSASSLSVVLEMDSLANIKALVSRGSGYTILAHAAVFDEVQRGSLVMVPITDPSMHRTLSLFRSPLRPATQAVREVERLIVEIAAELVRKRRWVAALPQDN